MAVRTVTVNLRLNAANYLRDGRQVVALNRDLDRSFARIDRSATAAGLATRSASRANSALARSAARAQNQVADLRREINRLRRAQQRLAAGGPINLVAAGGRGAARGGGGLLRSLTSGLGALPPQAQAAIATAVVGAVGSSLGGIILAAVGSSGLAAGIASSVLHDDDVQSAFTQFGRFVQSEFKSYGEAFDVPLIEAAERFHDRFASISPKIRGVLAEMSVGVRPIADGLIGLIERAGPGVAEALRASLPVLRALGRELPEVGDAFGDMFSTIAGGSEGATDGLIALLRGVEALARGVGGLTRAGSDILAFWFNLPAPLRMMLSGGPVGGFLLEGIHGGGKQRQLVDLGSDLDDVRYKADNTRAALAALTETMQIQANGILDVRAANRAFEESLDAITESAKKNGRTLDENTEKGRSNNEALDQAIRNAYTMREALLAQGATTAQANAAFNALIERVRAVATAMGFSKGQVDALITSLGKLPTGDKAVTYTVKTKYVEEGRRPSNTGPGVIQFQRQGGIVYARQGLMALGSTSGIVSGGRPLIGFGEPGTGGEAFIARNAPAGRSLAIANTAAGWHGGMVVPRGAVGNSTTVNVTVHAGLGTDGRQVGQQIVHSLRQWMGGKAGGNLQVAVMGRG